MTAPFPLSLDREARDGLKRLDRWKGVIRHVWSNELHALPMIALLGMGCLLLMLACWLSDCESDEEWKAKERELEEREHENAD